MDPPVVVETSLPDVAGRPFSEPVSLGIALGALGEGDTGAPDLDILIEGSIEGSIEVVVIAVINLACGIVGCSTQT